MENVCRSPSLKLPFPSYSSPVGQLCVIIIKREVDSDKLISSRSVNSAAGSRRRYAMRTKGYMTRRTVLLTGFLLACILSSSASARVNVDVNLNIGPPPIVAPAPPEVILMPNFGVYFVPGLQFDVFFHDGFWWSPRGDRWYRSQAYNGPWQVIERRYVPRPVIRVPGDYRGRYGRERHIPYGEWRERHFRGERHEGEHGRDRR